MINTSRLNQKITSVFYNFNSLSIIYKTLHASKWDMTTDQIHPIVNELYDAIDVVSLQNIEYMIKARNLNKETL